MKIVHFNTRWILILSLVLVFVTGIIALDPSMGLFAIREETFVDEKRDRDAIIEKDGDMYANVDIEDVGSLARTRPQSKSIDTSMERASQCPSLLVKRGNSLMLQFPPENKQDPIFFYNLDEYKNYVEIQQRRGVHCPVLYVQEENNAQGQDVYKMYSSPFYVEGGLPALPMSTAPQDRVQPVETRGHAAQKSVDGKYNRDQFPAFDPYGTYVGVYTDVDAAHDKTQSKTGSFSENAMDPNWGGVIYTQDAVDEGTYVGSTVQKASYPNLAPK